MLRGIKRQQNLTDRSLLWLKDLYIQLYFENKGQPLVADAIKVTTFSQITHSCLIIVLDNLPPILVREVATTTTTKPNIRHLLMILH